MKHSPPPAKTRASVGVLLAVGLALFTIACAKPAQNPDTAAHLQSDGTNPAPIKAVNINTASGQELETLPGIGKAIAERIIAHRERYGPFRRAEHLLMVRGVSDRKLRALLPMIAVD